LDKKNKIYSEIERVKNTIIKPNKKTNELLTNLGTSEINSGYKLSELLKRSEVTYEATKDIDPERPELDIAVQKEVEIMIKYEGYIELQNKQVESFKKMEKKLLSEDIDYNQIKGLRLEARQKLNKIKPYSVGQASRISGVSPADISVLLVYIEQQNRKDN
jgi:tRNA uridine 5-carboxymethylaminomethyl modification enzyme